MVERLQILDGQRKDDISQRRLCTRPAYANGRRVSKQLNLAVQAVFEMRAGYAGVYQIS